MNSSSNNTTNNSDRGNGIMSNSQLPGSHNAQLAPEQGRNMQTVSAGGWITV